MTECGGAMGLAALYASYGAGDYGAAEDGSRVAL